MDICTHIHEYLYVYMVLYHASSMNMCINIRIYVHIYNSLYVYIALHHASGIDIYAFIDICSFVDI